MENNDLLEMVRSKAQGWLTKSYDAETRAQVQALLDNEDPTELIECFYKDLEFGTGGLRGIMGVGSNRMNIYTVGAATQGLSNYLKKEFADLEPISSPLTASRFIYSKTCVRLRKCHSLSVNWDARAVSS